MGRGMKTGLHHMHAAEGDLEKLSVVRSELRIAIAFYENCEAPQEPWRGMRLAEDDSHKACRCWCTLLTHAKRSLTDYSTLGKACALDD